MKLIKTIRDADFGLPIQTIGAYQERRASRIVLFDDNKKIVLLFAANKQYHKLPGGGIESEETIIEALRRETIEGAGCNIKNIKELGKIEEYRDKFSLHQISYCFIGEVDGEKQAPQFEQEEIDDGFEIQWMSLDDAIKIIMSENQINAYEGKFIHIRDLAFLQAAKKYLSSH